MAESKPPTIRQIAEIAGVHFTTVSKILLGKSRASDGTRERVLEVARRLGYRPNPLASAWMAQRRAANPAKVEVNIGFIFPSAAELLNPSVEELRGILYSRAKAHGYLADEFMIDEYPSLEALARVLDSRGIRGLVWSGVALARPLPDGFANCAMCSFGGWIPGVPTVRTRAFEGMRITLAKLREKGFRRPALALTDRPTDWNTIRYEAAFRLFHERQGFSGEPLVLNLENRTTRDVHEVLFACRIDSVVTNTNWEFPGIPTASLDARPGTRMGIDQRRGLMAQCVIDQVAGLLISAVMLRDYCPKDFAVNPEWVDSRSQDHARATCSPISGL